MVAERRLRVSMPERVSAREKAEILAAIATKHGELTPTLVVRESDLRNTDGIAHRLAWCVGWDRSDEEAAQRWREDQARVVIRSVEPELIRLGVLTISAPHYVHDPTASPGEQGYVRLMSLKSKDEVAADALRSAVTQAVSALERAFGIAEALALDGEAAEILAALAALGRSPMAQAADVAESATVQG